MHIPGEFDKHFCVGSICHINAAEPVDADTIERLIHHCAEKGVIYWVINYALQRCGNGHISVGKIITKCEV